MWGKGGDGGQLTKARGLPVDKSLQPVSLTPRSAHSIAVLTKNAVCALDIECSEAHQPNRDHDATYPTTLPPFQALPTQGVVDRRALYLQTHSAGPDARALRRSSCDTLRSVLSGRGRDNQRQICGPHQDSEESVSPRGHLETLGARRSTNRMPNRRGDCAYSCRLGSAGARDRRHCIVRSMEPTSNDPESLGRR